MNHQVCDVKKKDYLELIDVWEKSVRATHDFFLDGQGKPYPILHMEDG